MSKQAKVYVVRDMVSTVVNGVFSTKELAKEFAEEHVCDTFIEDWDIESPIASGSNVYLTFDRYSELENVSLTWELALASGSKRIGVWQVDSESRALSEAKKYVVCEDALQNEVLGIFSSEASLAAWAIDGKRMSEQARVHVASEPPKVYVVCDRDHYICSETNLGVFSSEQAAVRFACRVLASKPEMVVLIEVWQVDGGLIESRMMP